MKKLKRTLTDQEWREVFKVRCKSKRGETLTLDESELFLAAHESDPKRYVAMGDDVFEATRPVGSTRKP